MNKEEIAKQIINAFDFMQKLYNESSYLIKEIEGQLGENEHRFQIFKTSGYAISGRSSNGLEPNNVNFWLLRKFGVAFVSEIDTELKTGQNHTKITDNLKVIYFRIILNEIKESEPKLIFGVFYDIKKHKDSIKKFENLMGGFEYIDHKLFEKFPDIDYEDGDKSIKGKFEKVNLLDLNTSEDLIDKVINPVIDIYENVNS